MNTTWDKLLSSIPIDKKAIIVTDWYRTAKDLDESIERKSVSIPLVVNIVDTSRKIALATNYPFLHVLKLIAQGYGFNSWQDLISHCPILKTLNLITVDKCHRSAQILKKKEKIKLSMSLEIIAWYLGFRNWNTAVAKLMPGPIKAKKKNLKMIDRKKTRSPSNP